MKQYIPIGLLTFVNGLGFAITIPVFPFIVEEEYGQPEWVYGLLIAAYSAFQFLATPFLGGLSDRFGRRKLLLISQAGTLFSWVIFGVAYFITDEVELWGIPLPLYVILFSRIVDGLTGGNVSVANAYVSDISQPEERTNIFGIMGAIFGLSMIIGPAIGGLAASTDIGYLGMVLVALVISFITLVSLWYGLEESLPAEKRAEQTKIAFWQEVNIFKKIGQFSSDRVLYGFLILRAVFALALAAYFGTILLFVQDVFDFSQTELGLFGVFIGFFVVINQGLLVNQVAKRIGDQGTLYLGMLLLSFGFVAITLSDWLPLYVVFYYIQNLGLSFCLPAFKSLLSSRASHQKQGDILGLEESIGALSMAIVPIAAATLYSEYGEWLYYGLSAFLFVSLFFFMSWMGREEKGRR